MLDGSVRRVPQRSLTFRRSRSVCRAARRGGVTLGIVGVERLFDPNQIELFECATGPKCCSTARSRDTRREVSRAVALRGAGAGVITTFVCQSFRRRFVFGSARLISFDAKANNAAPKCFNRDSSIQICALCNRSRDNHPLYFTRAFVNLEYARIAIAPFDR